MSSGDPMPHSYPDLADWTLAPAPPTTAAGVLATAPLSSSSSSDPNLVLTGVLMGIIVCFALILCYLLLPVILPWLRLNAHASSARVQRRYETIEGWLISKVCATATASTPTGRCSQLVPPPINSWRFLCWTECSAFWRTRNASCACYLKCTNWHSLLQLFL